MHFGSYLEIITAVSCTLAAFAITPLILLNVSVQSDEHDDVVAVGNSSCTNNNGTSIWSTMIPEELVMMKTPRVKMSVYL